MPRDPYFSTQHTLTSSVYDGSPRHLSVHDNKSNLSVRSGSALSSQGGSASASATDPQNPKHKGSFLKRAVKEILGGGGNNSKREGEHPKVAGAKKQLHAYGRGGAGRKVKKTPAPLVLTTPAKQDRDPDGRLLNGHKRTEKWVASTQVASGPTESNSNSTFASTRGLLPGESERSFGSHGRSTLSPTSISPSSSLPSSVPTPMDTPVHQRFDHVCMPRDGSHSGYSCSEHEVYPPDVRACKPGSNTRPHAYPYDRDPYPEQEGHRDRLAAFDLQNPNFHYLTSGYPPMRTPSASRSKPVRHASSHVGLPQPDGDEYRDDGCDDPHCHCSHRTEYDDYGVSCDDVQQSRYESARNRSQLSGRNHHNHGTYGTISPPHAMHSVSRRALPPVPAHPPRVVHTDYSVPAHLQLPTMNASFRPTYPSNAQLPISLSGKRGAEASGDRLSANLASSTHIGSYLALPRVFPESIAASLPSNHLPHPPLYTANASSTLTLHAPNPVDNSKYLGENTATYQSVVDHAQALQVQLQQSHQAERLALEERLQSLQNEVKAREDKMNGLLWLMGEMGLEDGPSSAAELSAANARREKLKMDVEQPTETKRSPPKKSTALNPGSLKV